MSIFKKISNSAKFVGASVELLQLKAEREELDENFAKLQARHADWQTKQPLKGPLLKMLEDHSQSVSQFEALASSRPDVVAILNSNLINLRNILQSLDDPNDVNDAAFEAARIEYEAKSEKIRARLAKVREVVH